MKPTEFIDMVLTFKVSDRQPEIDSYVTSVVGLPTFNRLNDLSMQDKFSVDDIKEIEQLISTVPAEISWYYCRHFYLSDDVRPVIDGDKALLQRLSDVRGIKVKGE